MAIACKNIKLTLRSTITLGSFLRKKRRKGKSDIDSIDFYYGPEEGLYVLDMEADHGLHPENVPVTTEPKC